MLGEGSARGNIPSFIVMDVMRAARAQETAGRSIIHMEVGQPATPAPKAARVAAMHALEGATLGYTMALGEEALRGRIAQLYREWYGVERGARAHRGDDGIVRRVRAGVPRRVRRPATRSRCPRPAIPATATSSARWGRRRC